MKMEAGEMKDKRVRYERTDVFVSGIKLIGCELYVVALLSVRRFPSKVPKPGLIRYATA